MTSSTPDKRCIKEGFAKDRDGVWLSVLRAYTIRLKERLSSFYKERRVWLRETILFDEFFASPNMLSISVVILSSEGPRIGMRIPPK